MKFSQLKLETPYLKLDPIFYDLVEPTPLHKPFLISASKDAAKLLNVDELDEALVEIVNGSKKLEGSQTFSMCYAGHQFGYFVPRLGDGRAINLGKANGFNLQLKGSGQTLYSRQGDGRAVLRSSIREYLMSEAMHGLGIATSRALALIGSDTDVARSHWEKGAIVLRLSPTWVRFGTFEYFNATKEHDKLKQLADYVIDESFPHLKGSDKAYLKMYKEIVRNTARTIAQWQSVGFNHGVMNTDNMSIDGRTIDYGPYAFLDDYDYTYVCNHTDVEGRYSFGNQPSVAHWNLHQLAKALSAIIDYKESLEILETFIPLFEKFYLEIMNQKLGLSSKEHNDLEFLGWLLGALSASPIDYTHFFRRLSFYDGKQEGILELVSSKEALKEWLDAYDERLAKETITHEDRVAKMQQNNPKYILKNHILQQAIQKAEKDDFSMIEDLLTVALDPYSEHEDLNYLDQTVPERFKNIKLSCSS